MSGSSRTGGTGRRPLTRRLVGVGLLAWPLLELVLLVAVGRVVGVLGVLLLLLAAAVAGVAVLRWVGVSAARRLAAAGGVPGGDALGRPPAATAPPAAPPGTALLVPAAFLLMVPGFLTDVVGLVLLVPAVRRSVTARLGEAVVRRASTSGVRFGAVAFGDMPFGGAPFGGRPGMRTSGPVEVRVHDVPPSAGSSTSHDPLAIDPPRP